MSFLPFKMKEKISPNPDTLGSLIIQKAQQHAVTERTKYHLSRNGLIGNAVIMYKAKQL